MCISMCIITLQWELRAVEEQVHYALYLEPLYRDKISNTISFNEA